jgi:hypothetical protein
MVFLTAGLSERGLLASPRHVDSELASSLGETCYCRSGDFAFFLKP